VWYNPCLASEFPQIAWKNKKQKKKSLELFLFPKEETLLNKTEREGEKVDQRVPL
jgi:hypothetical protein